MQTRRVKGRGRIRLHLLALLTAVSCQPTPSQPHSQLPYYPPDLVEWIWSGATTTSSAVVKARLAENVRRPRLQVVNLAKPDRVSFFEPAQWNEPFRIVEFRLDDLEPGSRYRYVIEDRGKVEAYRDGFFQTFPETGHAFKIAFGACARTGSNAAVFDTIRRHSPLVFLHLGDFHYGNVTESDPDIHLQALSHVLASPAQSALYRSQPVAYIWDDHDYGPDNSDRTFPGRSASRAAYQLAVPHYPLGAGSGDVPIYQSFSVGRIHFILTDSRSERDPPTQPRPRSLLGATQKAWFKQQLLEASRRAWLIVWVNSVPWIDSRDWADGWGAFSEEREEIARFITEESIQPMLILGGDAHMLALDDGTNSRYVADQPPIPVIHAAALDRPGSFKGGPYSHGAFPGGGFFGLLEVQETETDLIIDLSGRDWRNVEILSHRFSVPKTLP